MPRDDESIISSTERLLERSQNKTLTKFSNIPILDGRVAKKVIPNFTCPGCEEFLGEVISINGKVRGWCGNTHTYINEGV